MNAEIADAKAEMLDCANELLAIALELLLSIEELVDTEGLSDVIREGDLADAVLSVRRLVEPESTIREDMPGLPDFVYSELLTTSDVRVWGDLPDFPSGRDAIDELDCSPLTRAYLMTNTFERRMSVLHTLINSQQSKKGRDGNDDTAP